MTQRETLWTLVRGGARLRLLLVEAEDGTVECAIVSGVTRIAAGFHPTRDLAGVWGEHLRQTYLAEGWHDDGQGE
jgi:hypothetical protein